MERITKTIILLGVPFVFILVILLTDGADWVALSQGVVGLGEGYRFMPEGIVLATFLGAFAYAGAGGNLNLTQSIYIKEKGYGMGKYAQKISGLFKILKNEKKIDLEGKDFEITPESKKRFNVWWRRVSIEHAIVFWLIGAISILLLMILAYATTYGVEGTAEGINFVIHEGSAIGAVIGPWAGVLFLIVVVIMLFQTQLGVMDSTSRIMAENLAITKIKNGKDANVCLSRIYFGFVWAQIAFGSLLFLLNFSEPKTLIVLGAVINAFAMFVHVGLVTYLNQKALPKFARARLWRKLIMGLIFAFFGFFSIIVIIDKLF